jgi:D-glycero-D-manno-heptose 1,7-bisphosphate phosphatase
MSRKAVFLDRDGVINHCVDRGLADIASAKVRWTAPYRYDEFKLKSGARESLELLGRHGLLRILVTNQPDIAYGNPSPEDHERIMAEIKNLPLNDIFICYHRREEGCVCKKPLTGMLLEAARKWDIDLAG